MPSTPSLLLAAIALASGLTACDGGDDDGPYAAQIVSPSCGPVDQRSLVFELGRSVDLDTCAASLAHANVGVTVNLEASPIEGPITFEITDGSDGSVRVCPGGNASCLTGVSATVQLDDLIWGEGAVGRVTIRGEDSVLAEVDIDAAWCQTEPQLPACG